MGTAVSLFHLLRSPACGKSAYRPEPNLKVVAAAKINDAELLAKPITSGARRKTGKPVGSIRTITLISEDDHEQLRPSNKTAA